MSPRKTLSEAAIIATLRSIPEHADILFDARVEAGVLTGWYHHPDHLERALRVVLQGGVCFLSLHTADWTSTECPTGSPVEKIRDGSLWLETGDWPQRQPQAAPGDSDDCGANPVSGDGPDRASEAPGAGEGL